MWGQLCFRGSHEPATVQLLVHGATYNHLYWNFPHGNGCYSYVEGATAAGYATFDIDRVGDGSSSHPPSSQLDTNAGAVALHDAVTALRAGAVDGDAFQHVIMVGHPLGSAEAWIEAARYHDPDAVIITGALHALGANVAELQADLYPRRRPQVRRVRPGQRLPDHAAWHPRVAFLLPGHRRPGRGRRR